MRHIYIIDAVNFLFRSYYAIGPMTGPDGQSTGALYGFIRSLFKLMRDFSPEHLVAVFDGPDNKQRRTKLYSEYKSHRQRMPEDLFSQLEKAVLFCDIAGIPHLEVPGVEADDTMGTIAIWAAQQESKAFLCTSDKDLCQLVNENIHVLNVHKDNLDIDSLKVKEIYGVKPELVVDLLALVGDASDNIPGVEGFGSKTAVALLEEFGSLDELLKHPEKVKGEKKQKALKEGKEIALLSKELASLYLDVKIPQEESFYHLRAPDVAAVKNFYQSHRFLSLLKDLDAEKTPQAPSAVEKTVYVTIDQEIQLIELVALLKKEKHLTIDTETTSLHPMQARIVGIGLAKKVGEAWYIPCNSLLGKAKVLELLSPLLSSKEIGWVGHNIKYDMHALANEGIFLNHVAFDTMIASYLLAPQNQRHNLDDLSFEKFEKKKIPIESLIGKGQKQLCMSGVPIEKVSEYCCEDVDYTLRLYELFSKELKQENLEEVINTIELPLISVLFQMERQGIRLDTERLKEFSVKIHQQLETLQNEIFSLAGNSFNLNSPKQLSAILFEKLGIHPPKKTATGYSTNAEVLESLKDQSPIIEKILQYRVLEKLRSTYTDALVDQVHTDHRVHCTFNQSVAATGRLSCQNPNLQNIPIRTVEGRIIRSAFVPSEKNYLMLSADYSQIELRLLAHFSEDAALIKAFQQEEDVHAHTASLVFDIPLNQVTPEMRQQAKAVNFGILYGQGAFGLSQQIGVSQKEASQFIETYFDRYKDVKKFLESCKEKARHTGYAITLTGRKRPIPDILSTNLMIRSAAERLAINTPLQGTAADLIKLAMLHLQAKLQNLPKLGRLLLQIHDELILEGPEDSIISLGDLAKECMVRVFSLKVPLVVDISIGKNWGEC
ncbi:MAG: DNA polymerase I [Simkania sp.]|nr:DNA polymerase I [Simkania sp.]